MQLSDYTVAQNFMDFTNYSIFQFKNYVIFQYKNLFDKFSPNFQNKFVGHNLPWFPNNQRETNYPSKFLFAKNMFQDYRRQTNVSSHLTIFQNFPLLSIFKHYGQFQNKNCIQKYWQHQNKTCVLNYKQIRRMRFLQNY
jgi:hypothetical protein